MRPTFVPFTPWTTLDDYIDILEFIEGERLIDHVDPVQYSIRLLVPPGSLLLAQRESEKWLGGLIQDAFTYEWKHPDSRMDDLQASVSALVERATMLDEDAAQTFCRAMDLAYSVRGDD